MIYVACIYVSGNAVYPVTPSLFLARGYPDYMFGVSTAVMSVCIFLFSPFWGQLCMRIGAARSVSVSMLCYGLSQLFFYLAREPWQVVLAQLKLTSSRIVL